MQIFPSLNCNMAIFLPRRRFVPETFCYRRRSVTETFCHGDVLLRSRFVTETFCMGMFCRGDVLCGDILYVRRFHMYILKTMTHRKCIILYNVLASI
jgi:hypothetical protein